MCELPHVNGILIGSILPCRGSFNTVGIGTIGTGVGNILQNFQ